MTRSATLTARHGLARSGSAELELARTHRDALVAAAVALAAASGHRDRNAGCRDAGCALRHEPATGPSAAALCATAHRLARLPDAPASTGSVPPTTAVAAFLDALEGAADAIRACRQTAHAAEGCWFAHESATDGCGEVLGLLHRYG